MRNLKSYRILFSILLLCFSICLNARESGKANSSFATIVSNGSGNWTTPTTWIGGVVPTSSDIVEIKAGDSVYTSSAIIHNGAITGGGVLLINANFTMNSPVTISVARFYILGTAGLLGSGAKTFNGTTLNCNYYLGGTGTYIFNNNAVLNLIGSTNYLGGAGISVNILNNGTINWNNGSINFGSNHTCHLTNNGAINFNVTANSNWWNTRIINYGLLNKNGNNAITIVKVGASGRSSLINENGGIIKGLGSLFSLDTLTLKSGGIINPADVGIGKLTISNATSNGATTSIITGVFNVDIGGVSSNDTLNIVNIANINGLSLNVNWGSHIPGIAETFTILTAGAITGNFSSITLPPINGNTFGISYSSNIVKIIGCTDNDSDGYSTCNGDCDDNNNLIHPGATEICGNNIDEDCDGNLFNSCPFITAASGNWNSPSTWQANAVPLANNEVVISAGHTVSMNTTTHTNKITVNGILNTANNITMSGNVSISGDGQFNIGNNLTINNNIQISIDSFNVLPNLGFVLGSGTKTYLAGTTVNNHYVLWGTGEYIFEVGSILNLYNLPYLGGGGVNITMTNRGTVNWFSGNINVNAGHTCTFHNYGVINVNHNSPASWLSTIINNYGTIQKNNDNVTTINRATTGSSSINNLAGGIIKGIGTFYVHSLNSVLTFSSSSELQPGNSFGRITFNRDVSQSSTVLNLAGTFKCEINGNDTGLHDQLSTISTMNISNLNLEVDWGYTPANDDTIIILTGNLIQGQFLSTYIPSVSGNIFKLIYQGNRVFIIKCVDADGDGVTNCDGDCYDNDASRTARCPVYSVQSGDWGSGTTWNTGLVPTDLDRIIISPNHIVTVDHMQLTLNDSLDIFGTLRLYAYTNPLEYTGLRKVSGTGSKTVKNGGVLTNSSGIFSGSGDWVVEHGGELHNDYGGLSNGTTIINHGKIFTTEILSETIIDSISAGKLINKNNGLITGSSFARFEFINFINEGVINITSSTNSFRSISGSISVGAFINNGTITISGSYDFRSCTFLNNGIVNVTENGRLTFIGMNTRILGGNYQIDGKLFLTDFVTIIHNSFNLTGVGTLGICNVLEVPYNYQFNIPEINVYGYHGANSGTGEFSSPPIPYEYAGVIWKGKIRGDGIKTFNCNVYLYNECSLEGIGEFVLQNGKTMNFIPWNEFYPGINYLSTLRNFGVINLNGLVNEFNYLRTAKIINEAPGIFNLNSGISNIEFINNGRLNCLASANFNILIPGLASLTNNGEIFLDNRTLNLYTSLNSTPAAKILGNGLIDIKFGNGLRFSTIRGQIEPGLSPGKIQVKGSYLNYQTTNYICEIAGDIPTIEYDQLFLDNLDNSKVSLTINFGSFTPSPGQKYAILISNNFTGSFASVSIPPIPNMSFAIQYKNNPVGTNDTVYVIVNGVSATYYQDLDNDTYGNPNVTIISVTQPVGYVTNSLDCNDTNNQIYPGANEICNQIDDDCDTHIDENLNLTNTFLNADTDSSSWAHSINWSLNVPPTKCQDVVVPSPHRINVFGLAEARSIWIHADAELNISTNGILELYYGNGIFTLKNEGDIINAGMLKVLKNP